jgi:hypothetical protein
MLHGSILHGVSRLQQQQQALRMVCDSHHFFILFLFLFWEGGISHNLETAKIFGECFYIFENFGKYHSTFKNTKLKKAHQKKEKKEKKTHVCE